MGTYDYEKLKDLYGANDYEPDTSGVRMSSKPVSIDIFDNDFRELDEISPTEEVNTPLTYMVKEETLDVDPFRLEPISLEEPAKEIVSPESITPNMDETMKIETLTLDNINPKVMKAIDDKYEGIMEEKKNPRLLTRLFPWTNSEDHHLEYAFVNCAVLGFITASMGSGMLLYILNHI